MSENKTALITTTIAEKSEVSNEMAQVSSLIAARSPRKNLLATAMVRVVAKNGEKILMKAVCDQGSQSAMITEQALQVLKIAAKRMMAEIDGIGDTTKVANKYCEFSMLSRFSDDYALNIEAIVLKKITNYSTFKSDLKQYDYLQNLRLADPTVDDDREIDILLGVAEYAKFVKNGLIKGQDDEPIAQNSELGWLIMGPAELEERKRQVKITTLITNVEIENKLTEFFEAEGLEEEDKCESQSEEEAFCEENYQMSTKRDADGRFVVKMPFKNGIAPQLGDSRKAALAVLFQLEERFKRQPKWVPST